MDPQSNNNPYLQNSILDSKYFNPEYLFTEGVDALHGVGPKVFRWENITGFNNILFFFAIFFITVILYSAVRLFEIRKKEHAHLHHEILEYAHHHAEMEKKKQEGEGASKNERWVQTLHYLFSTSAGEWKLAIIEADSMLESLLEQLGFQGETVGDMLKSADPLKFRSLTTAWEVHTIRNRIAHEGAAFQLSQHEAKRVIALYEMIFRQYGFI